MRIHGVLIILKRGTQFTAQFLLSFQKGLASKVNISTSFHPHKDGYEEHTTQTLEFMFIACVIDLTGKLNDHLPLIDFAYNNSYHSSIQMALHEALYGRRFRSPIKWFKVGEIKLIWTYLIHKAMEKVKNIQERLKTSQSSKFLNRYEGKAIRVWSGWFSIF